MPVERRFRGISERLAIHYLEGLGGDRTGEHEVTGDEWSVTLSTEIVEIGPTLELPEVVLEFEGDDATLDDLLPRFRKKAMRAGG